MPQSFHHFYGKRSLSQHDLRICIQHDRTTVEAQQITMVAAIHTQRNIHIVIHDQRSNRQTVRRHQGEITQLAARGIIIGPPTLIE